MNFRQARISTFITAIITAFFTVNARAADLPSVDSYGDRIVVTKDIPYAKDAQPWQKLDLYLPRGSGPFPMVVCWFGGGFTGGNKGGMAKVCAFMADKGIAAAAPGYFLAVPKEDKRAWPQNVYDAKGAVRFLRANAATYHLDANHVAGLGHSSGAYLAMMVGLTSDIKDLDGNAGWNDQSSRLSAIVNISGVSDRRGGLGTGTLYLLGKGYEDKIDLRTLASPVAHISKESPAVYTLHGQDDKTVIPDSATKLNDALQSAGVEHELHLIPKLGHNPINVETMESVRAWLLKKFR